MKKLIVFICIVSVHLDNSAQESGKLSTTKPSLSTEEVLGLLNINKTPAQQGQKTAQPPKTQALDVNALRQGMGQEVLSHLSEIEQKLDAIDGKINQLLKACGSTPALEKQVAQPTVEKPAAVPTPPQTQPASPPAPTKQPAQQSATQKPMQGAAAQELISELKSSPDLNKRLQELKEFTESEGIKSNKPMLRKLLEEKLEEQSTSPSH